ncbi:Ig-like domain-containing protein, partial [Brumimicrobium mesophilum]|uniref:Ig-like domain-containing protein n=1 Tax=Brumimicrobium mesophilum TaxID=392717 RepID=UPI0018FEEE6F
YILNVNGCTDTATTVVTISATPQAPAIASSDVELCAGGTFSLSTSTVASSYSWTGPNGFSSTSQYPQAIIASGLTAGIYNLTVTDNGCVSEVASIEIDVNPLPSQPTITGPTSICFGEPIVLTTSSTCASFKWIGPGGASVTTLANPLLTTGVNTTTIPSTDPAYAAGDWSVVCISADGCESQLSNPINITINAIPVALASNDGPICNDGTVTLTGNTAAGATYEWYNDNYTTLLSTNAVHSINNLSVGTYTYNYVLTVNGCSDTATTVVNVSATLPAPTIASTDVELCEGGTFSLSTSTVANSYLWNGPNGFSSTN